MAVARKERTMELCGERDSSGDLLCILQKGHKGDCNPYYNTFVPKLGLKLPEGTERVLPPDPGSSEQKPTRKVVHITTMGVGSIFALCDDGTIWQMCVGKEWILIKNVPQMEVVR